MLDLSARQSVRSNVSPFVVMDVMEAAAQLERSGRRVIHLEVGQPSTAAPRPAIARAYQALDRDKLGYTSAIGIPELRNGLAKHYAARYGLPVEQDRIVVTAGSSGAFVLSFLAAFEPGARVAVPAPGYPCYANILTALGVEVIRIPTRLSNDYQLLVDDLKPYAAQLAGVVIASPSNPTGATYNSTELSELSDYCGAHGIRLISDEIYHGIEFDAPSPTAASYSDESIVVGSFSKYFSMTGWRIGWMVLPRHLVRPVERLSQNLFIAPSTLSQHAAVGALGAREELESHVKRYAANRNIIKDCLDSVGLGKYPSPSGAFYVYVDISDLGIEGATFCSRLLAEKSVAMTPGDDFDPVRGSDFVRFSYAASTEDVSAGAAGFAEFVRELRR